MGIEVRRRRPRPTACPTASCRGVLVQYPGASGRILDPRPLIEAAHERGALAVVAADLLALTLLEAPGRARRRRRRRLRRSASACRCSTAARTPASWPSRAGLERHLPGRLVGVSVDAEGRPAYRLALQTREQHIRRDKATSNICTAQVLLAVVASMYAVYHGPEGLRAIATRTHRYAAVLAAGAARRRRRGRARRRSSTPLTVRGARPGRRRRRRGPRARRCTCASSTPTTSASPPRRPRPGSTLTSVLRAFGVDAPTSTRVDAATGDALPDDAAPRDAVPHPRGVLHPPQRDRRCCATCAGSRRATTRSTAA